MPGDRIKHPSPAEAFELAANHAALLRGLFLDPRYKYAQDPTPTFIKPNLDETPPGLYFVSDFIQNTYDEQTSTLKDKDGNAIEFPKIPEREAVKKMGDVITRGFMARKIILDNRTDLKARLMVGGQPFDFGKEVEEAVKKTYPE
ncbi:hypothetical protein F4774DRAFT_405652 [Daldinia eschscholtzii]|nr:hypothetical protein F4774DRAFT_405652 [Daldinia eschscholtzii]